MLLVGVTGEMVDRYDDRQTKALQVLDVASEVGERRPADVVGYAVRNGTSFDVASSAIVLVGYAIPGFLFAILLVVLFAGGSFVQWFPLRGLTSPGSADWAWPARVGDYLWHMVLPTIALVAGGFASLTMLTKNCFLDEIRKQYVITARAKGAGENRVLYGHVFRNAKLLIDAGAAKVVEPAGPTVVIEQGAGEPARFWWPVQEEIAKFARVCTYDRAGVGWSEATQAPRSRRATGPACMG